MMATAFRAALRGPFGGLEASPQKTTYEVYGDFIFGQN